MDRKTLKQQYKNTPRPMGIYRVRNVAEDMSLIGSSLDLPATLNGQQARLQLKGHPNARLQNDWNRLGPDAFEFEVLDTLAPPEQPGYDPIEDLRVLEQLWLERLTPFDEKGYNVRGKLSR